MSQQNDAGYKGFTAGGAIGIHILVKLSSGNLAVAGLADEPIGVTQQAAFASGDRINVALLSKQGSAKMTAGGAVAEGAVVYGRASGQIDDVATSAAVRVGVALEAAAASGDIIEVMLK